MHDGPKRGAAHKAARAWPSERGYRHILILFGQHYRFSILNGVAAFAAKEKWFTSPLSYSGSVPLTNSNVSCDGILIGDRFPHHVLEAIIDSGIPCVNMTTPHHPLTIPCVIGDHLQIGRLAAEHFTARGYRHFSYYGIQGRSSSTMRMQGFCDTLATDGYACTDLTDTDGASTDETDSPLPWEDERLKSLLMDLQLPNAILGYNDALAVVLLIVCRHLGFRVPDDIAILGVDDDPIFCQGAEVPLSSVKHDLFHVGYQAAEYLNRIIDGEEPSSRPVLVRPSGIAVRQSTDHLAVHHPELRKALMYIQTHYNEQIGVSQVAASTRLSRRALQHVFRKDHRISVTGYIKTVRLARAKDLLIQTDKPIATIAAECGFRGVEYFHRVFKSSEGCTPRQFRVEHW